MHSCDLNIEDTGPPRKKYTIGDLYPGMVVYAPNQGSSITPRTRKVMIRWVTSQDVHYSTEEDPKLDSTPIERFLEIINQQG